MASFSVKMCDYGMTTTPRAELSTAATTESDYECGPPPETKCSLVGVVDLEAFDYTLLGRSKPISKVSASSNDTIAADFRSDAEACSATVESSSDIQSSQSSALKSLILNTGVHSINNTYVEHRAKVLLRLQCPKETLYSGKRLRCKLKEVLSAQEQRELYPPHLFPELYTEGASDKGAPAVTATFPQGYVCYVVCHGSAQDGNRPLLFGSELTGRTVELLAALIPDRISQRGAELSRKYGGCSSVQISEATTPTIGVRHTLAKQFIAEHGYIPSPSPRVCVHGGEILLSQLNQFAELSRESLLRCVVQLRAKDLCGEAARLFQSAESVSAAATGFCVTPEDSVLGVRLKTSAVRTRFVDLRTEASSLSCAAEKQRCQDDTMMVDGDSKDDLVHTLFENCERAYDENNPALLMVEEQVIERLLDSTLQRSDMLRRIGKVSILDSDVWLEAVQRIDTVKSCETNDSGASMINVSVSLEICVRYYRSITLETSKISKTLPVAYMRGVGCGRFAQPLWHYRSVNTDGSLISQTERPLLHSVAWDLRSRIEDAKRGEMNEQRIGEQHHGHIGSKRTHTDELTFEDGTRSQTQIENTSSSIEEHFNHPMAIFT